jgi:hypothetical protein
MNLKMEISSLGVAFAACVTSVFGMNLVSGLEDQPFAFYVVSCFVVVASVSIVAFCASRLKSIKTSVMTSDYPVLKNIFK